MDNLSIAVPHGAGTSAPEAAFGTLAMSVLADSIAQRETCCALDLGHGSGANVRFLSEYASRIVIEDLPQTLMATGQPFSGKDRIYCPVYEALLPYQEGTRFDLILLWDLLDYLDRDDIARLASHIARFCRRGTVIYALVSIRQKIPATPTNFRIIDKGHLVYQYTTGEQRDCARYTQRGLLELLRGFRVKRSFLLQNGIQEYLFEFG